MPDLPGRVPSRSTTEETDADDCCPECNGTDKHLAGCPWLPGRHEEPVECCASGKCEVCAPGGFGGSRYW